MGLGKQARDWEVAGVTNLGGGAFGIAAGAWLFIFKSDAAKVKEPVIFVGYGLGVGATIKGVPITGAGTVSVKPNNYTSIDCDDAFSIYDLNWGGGRLTSATASFMGGYGLTWISAFNTQRVMFTSEFLSGWCTGVALSAVTTAGIWKVLNLNATAYKGLHKKVKSNVRY